MSNLSLRYPNQCFLYHSIMSDMIYLCCTDMRCSLFLFTFSLPSFDFPSFFSYYLFHFRSIPTPIHLLNLTHFFTSFTLFVDGLTTSPSFSFHSQHLHRLLLSSHAHEILLRVVRYMQGYGLNHWVFEPSFLSFLSPYCPGLRYIPCLKTTLRPRDQKLSLIVFTWMGLCRLVEV